MFARTNRTFWASKRALGNNDLSFTGRYGNGELAIYDGRGYPTNPITGERYAPQVVKRGDYARVIAEFRAGLDDRERALLDERIVAEDPQTLQQIGDRFGVTREAVRQSEARLLQRLRVLLEDRLGDSGVVRVDPANRKPRN